MKKQNFGGSWTEKKLEILKKYLQAYSTIMNKQKFQFAYIDGFAGTGYRKDTNDQNTDMLWQKMEQEGRLFIKGSARISLEITPKFHKYIFIEKDEKTFKALSNIKKDFPDLKDKIEMVNKDANIYIKEMCQKSWQRHRAVMFLDPFGMEVKWDTIKDIAKTKAIDLWTLFPLGIGVNRLLKKDGELQPWAIEKLNTLFGHDKWIKEFYKPSTQMNLLKEKELQKTATFEDIKKYFINQLKTVFTQVVDDPAILYNSKNNPLFLLCFGAGNPKGAVTAVKIAQDILHKI